MAEEAFEEVQVPCPDCGHDFPIMVHSDRGSTVTVCEDCLNRLEVTAEGGEVVNVELRG
jgi:ribosomal protein S27E